MQGLTSNDKALDDLHADFGEFSFSGFIERDDAHGARHLPWIIEVTLAAPFAAFFAKFGEAAGTDAYQSLRAWLAQIHERGGERALVLRVRAGATTVEMKSSLPEDALAALLHTDWSQIDDGILEWDPSRRRWRNLESS